MHPASVPARLVEAGVPVVTGDAQTITYRAGNHAVTADLIVAERVSSPTLALDRSRSRTGHRIFVVCDTISAQARSALLAEGASTSASAVQANWCSLAPFTALLRWRAPPRRRRT